MNLIELKPGDDVDASVLEHNFTELKNAISENSNTDARIDEEIIPVLAQLKEADTKTKNDLSSAQQGLSSDIKAVQNNLSGSQAQITNLEKRAYITSSYISGTSWYRVWSDGWIEQGGAIINSNGSGTVNFLKAFSNTDYFIGGSSIENNKNDSGGTSTQISFDHLSKSSFYYSKSTGQNNRWYAKGK